MVDNFANLANRSGEGRRITAPTIRNYWHFWQLQTDSQDCQSANRIGNLGNGQTDCQDCQWSDRPTPIDHAPGTRCQAWFVMPIRSVIVLFARSLFAVGFLLAKPPPRADGLAGQGRWVHKKFFLFLKIQHAYTKVLECLTLAL